MASAFEVLAAHPVHGAVLQGERLGNTGKRPSARRYIFAPIHTHVTKSTLPDVVLVALLFRLATLT
jgi:hypothetical protein